MGGEEREGQNEQTLQYAGNPSCLLIVRLFCLCPERLRSWNNKKRHCNKKMAMNSASLSGNLSSSSEAAAWAPAAIMSLQPRISTRPALLSLSPWYTSSSSHIIQVMYIFS